MQIKKLLPYALAAIAALLVAGSAIYLYGQAQETSEGAAVSNIAFIIPEASENLVLNPSIEIDTTGYTAVGAAIARTIGQQQRGAYSLQITPTAGANDGAYYAITLLATTQYTFSVDVLGASAIPYRLRVHDVTGAVDLGTFAFTGRGDWQKERPALTFTTGANTNIRLYVEKDNSADTTAIYIDGLQLEAKAYATTYVDGDQDDGQWKGAPHASTSSRSDQLRGGGRVIDPETYGFAISASSGMGMPPNRHITHELPQQPGALLQDVKTLPRVITLTGSFMESSESNLYTARAQLVDALKIDRVGSLQPVTLRFTGTSQTLEIPCFYDDGMNQTLLKLFYEDLVLRLICYQPFWHAIGENAVALDSIDTFTMENVVARINGVWDPLGPPSFGATVDAIVVDKDGDVYVSGNFVNWDGIANADYVVRYDAALGTWNALETGMDGRVRAMALDTDGKSVYLTGDFANAGTTAAVRIAKYDPAGDSFSALSTGINATGFALAVSADGIVWVGGSFTSPGNYIASWDGTAFSALGSGLNLDASEIVIDPRGNPVVFGEFTTAGGGTAKFAARWLIETSAWEAITDDLSLGNVILAGEVSDAGRVYGGRGNAPFAVATSGSGWETIGADVNGVVRAVAVRDDFSLIFGGDFTKAGSVDLSDGVAQWNRFAWSHMDIDMPGTPSIFAVTVDEDDIYLGGNGASGTASASGLTTVTNVGSAKAFPKIIITRSGGTSATLRSINNQTQGIELLFDLDIFDGETITIDLTPGKKTITSDFRGNVIGYKLPGPGLVDFSLLPGNNTISMFVSEAGSPTITATMRWQDTYWSVDGAE